MSLPSPLCSPFAHMFLGGWPLLRAHAAISLLRASALAVPPTSRAVLQTPPMAAPARGDFPSATLPERPFWVTHAKAPPCSFLSDNPFSFRPCIIICNYIHACAYLAQVCLLRGDQSSMSGCPRVWLRLHIGTSQRAWPSAVTLT